MALEAVLGSGKAAQHETAEGPALRRFVQSRQDIQLFVPGYPFRHGLPRGAGADEAVIVPDALQLGLNLGNLLPAAPSQCGRSNPGAGLP